MILLSQRHAWGSETLTSDLVIAKVFLYSQCVCVCVRMCLHLCLQNLMKILF